MPSDRLSAQLSASGLLFLLAVLVLAGCSMPIPLQRSHDPVDLFGPADAVLFRLDTVPVPLEVYYRSDSSRYILLPTDSDQHVIVRSGEGPADTLLLRRFMLIPSVLGGEAAVVPPSVVGPGGGMMAMGYSFGGRSIVYAVVDMGGGPTGRWEVVPEYPEDPFVSSSQKRKKNIGIVVQGHVGGNWPGIVSPEGTEYRSLGAGYEVLPGLALCGTGEWHRSADLSDYQGNLRLEATWREGDTVRGYPDIKIRTFGLYTRYQPLDWLFVSAGAGWTSITTDSLYLAGTTTRVAGFADGLPTANVGVGLLWKFIVMEYRRVHGLQRVVLDPESSGRIQWENLRFGLTFTF